MFTIDKLSRTPIYEQLIAQKQAADMAGLSRSDVENLFHGNAEQFFGITM